MKKIILLFALAIIIISCNSTQYLHETGTYTIKQRAGDQTEFYEVRGRYTINSDTLKTNDKILINVVRPLRFNSISKMKNYMAKLD